MNIETMDNEVKRSNELFRQYEIFRITFGLGETGALEALQAAQSMGIYEQLLVMNRTLDSIDKSLVTLSIGLGNRDNQHEPPKNKPQSRLP